MVKVSGEITCCVGRLQVATTIQKIKLNWMVMMQIHVWWAVGHPHHSRFGRQVKVSGFDGTKSDDAKTVPGVLGYMDSGTGDKFMQVVHQALFLIPKMTVNLLGLMQLCNNGLKRDTGQRSWRIPIRGWQADGQDPGTSQVVGALFGRGSPECMKIPKLHLQATGDM